MTLRRRTWSIEPRRSCRVCLRCPFRLVVRLEGVAGEAEMHRMQDAPFLALYKEMTGVTAFHGAEIPLQRICSVLSLILFLRFVFETFREFVAQCIEYV
jgi:hypothetical protein